MIFNELYSTYYKTMTKIIEKSIEHPLQLSDIRNIVNTYAFEESILKIESSIAEEKWQFIKKDGTTVINNKPSMPFTYLQKRWLKAISLDPRMKLFIDEIQNLEDVEPLFTDEDYYVFDKYSDGDPYEDEAYIRNFRTILDAIRNHSPLSITTLSRHGREFSRIMLPEKLEYSEKDDKFRLIGVSKKQYEIINLGRVLRCSPSTEVFVKGKYIKTQRKMNTVEFELIDERNALERVLLHFSHFKKQAIRLDDKRYKINIEYDIDDETEILIRILSFGPLVKVVGPANFINLIKDRLRKQIKFCHKILEERAADYNGKLMTDGEYDWGEKVGREI